MPIEPKLGRLKTYCERFPPLKPHDRFHVTTLSSHGNLKDLYIHCHNTCGH